MHDQFICLLLLNCVLDSDDSAAFDAPAEVDSVVKDEDHNDGDDDDDGDAATSPVDPIPLTVDTALNDADDNVDEFEGGDVKDDDTDFEAFGNEAHNESDVSHPHCQTVSQSESGSKYYRALVCIKCV
jgi:hypothetical protein